MSPPKRKSPAGRRGLENSICLGGRENYSAFLPPASARFDSDGLVLPNPRKGGQYIAKLLVESGALAAAFAEVGDNLLHTGSHWYVHRDGQRSQLPRGSFKYHLHQLLSRCIFVNRAGQLCAFPATRSRVGEIAWQLKMMLHVVSDEVML
ncbi:hypothetical protein [Rhodanobacter umsongensis]